MVKQENIVLFTAKGDEDLTLNVRIQDRMLSSLMNIEQSYLSFCAKARFGYSAAFYEDNVLCGFQHLFLANSDIQIPKHASLGFAQTRDSILGAI